MITEEMSRLKSELYSEHGGLAEIQRSLETLKTNPLMRCERVFVCVCVSEKERVKYEGASLLTCVGELAGGRGES